MERGAARPGRPAHLGTGQPARSFSRQEAASGRVLHGPARRAVVRAENHQTHATRLYSALVNTIEDRVPGDPHVIVTVTVLGDDTGDCLAAGGTSSCGAAATSGRAW